MYRTALLSITLTLVFCAGARADIEVNARLDTIVLNDGTEIQCLILMMSPAGVVIVETDAKDPEKKTQRTLQRTAIRNIVIGERSGRTEELLTDTEMARKVVLGKSAHKEDAIDKNDGGKQAAASKKKSAVKKKSASATATNETAPADPAVKPAAPAQEPQRPAPNTVTPDAPVVLPPETLPTKELSEAYLGRFPDLQSAAMDIAGAQRIQDWLDGARTGNENARRPIETLLKTYLGAGDNDPAAQPYKSANPKSPWKTDRTIKMLGADAQPAQVP